MFHDSPNAPATARSVYVIAHPAARPSCQAPWAGGDPYSLRTAGAEGEHAIGEVIQTCEFSY